MPNYILLEILLEFGLRMSGIITITIRRVSECYNKSPLKVEYAP